MTLSIHDNRLSWTDVLAHNIRSAIVLYLQKRASGYQFRIKGYCSSVKRVLKHSQVSEWRKKDIQKIEVILKQQKNARPFEMAKAVFDFLKTIKTGVFWPLRIATGRSELRTWIWLAVRIYDPFLLTQLQQGKQLAVSGTSAKLPQKLMPAFFSVEEHTKLIARVAELEKDCRALETENLRLAKQVKTYELQNLKPRPRPSTSFFSDEQSAASSPIAKTAC